MIGNLVADLSHVTIPAIQRREIENLRQADETLATSVARGIGPLDVEWSLIDLADHEAAQLIQAPLDL
jgi:catalase